MRPHSFSTLGAALVLLASCATTRATTTAPAAVHEPPQACERADQRTSLRARALVARYCANCHSPSGSAGDEHDFSQPGRMAAEHRLIAARLRARSMPPRSFPSPDPGELAFLIQWAGCGAKL